MPIFREKTFKCPYCLHKFKRAEAKMNRNPRGEEYFMCPNPELEEGRPICGKRLPQNFFSSDSSVISIVGGAGTGKTYFVMALRRILDMGVLLGRLGISGTMYYPDNESEIYFENLWQYIINGKKLDGTHKNEGVERHALCLKVNISNKRKTVYFSFFDNPGEGFKSDTNIYDNMNLRLSDAVIFLMSPEQFPKILDRVNGRGLSDRTTSLNTVLTNIQGVFNSDKEVPENESFISGLMRRLPTPKKIHVPFAFCLSKFDLLGYLFSILDYHFPRDLTRADFQTLGIISDGVVDKGIIDTVIDENSDIILKTLDKNDECILGNYLNYFDDYKILAVQSVEVKINASGNEVVILSPRGISLTMYWIFKKLNLL